MLAPVASLNQPQVGAAEPPVASQAAPVLPPVWMMTCVSAEHIVRYRKLRQSNCTQNAQSRIQFASVSMLANRLGQPPLPSVAHWCIYG